MDSPLQPTQLNSLVVLLANKIFNGKTVKNMADKSWKLFVNRSLIFTMRYYSFKLDKAYNFNKGTISIKILYLYFPFSSFLLIDCS